ncbi:MAG: response regulator transcription factor [Nitrospinae bacterium]|nr:response regulator transcription factor [Nitrospinota bacterium]
MTRALIAEDEKELRGHLARTLKKLWPELEICAMAGNGAEALAMFEEHKPDIAFLDIRMPGKSGMEIARRMNGCHIVFVTAYDQYAVEAFEQYAVDYILKPVTEERLEKTVSRLKTAAKGNSDIFAQAIEQVAARLAAPKSWLQWVRAQSGASVRMIHVDDVVYFRSEDKYTVVRLADGEALIRSPLKTMEAELDPGLFWRVHRNAIINIRWVESATRMPSGALSLKLKCVAGHITASRQYAHLFHQM